MPGTKLGVFLCSNIFDPHGNLVKEGNISCNFADEEKIQRG